MLSIKTESTVRLHNRCTKNVSLVISEILTDVFVSDTAGTDDAAAALDADGTVEWNLMNDNPYGTV